MAKLAGHLIHFKLYSNIYVANWNDKGIVYLLKGLQEYDAVDKRKNAFLHSKKLSCC